MKIGMIGAGNAAKNLGRLLSDAGHEVVYGARNPKDRQTTITAAADFGEVVFLAIPYGAKNELAEKMKEHLTDKVIVDITNATNNSDWSPVDLGAQNSSGEETARILPRSMVVKAFNDIFAEVMVSGKQNFGGEKLTSFICGDSGPATEIVAKLASDAGFSPLIVGGIKNSRYLEAMAHLNIAIAVGQGKGTEAGYKYFIR